VARSLVDISPVAVRRFWSKVSRGEPHECWLWKGYKQRSGYGQFGFRGEVVYAHRFAYIASIGDIPEGMFVCHTCDIPSCCNPAHLYVGTQRDNMRDASVRGRTRTSRYTASQVDEMRRLHDSGLSYQKIARRYKVAHATIRELVVGIRKASNDA
jgi:hypothetical protein